MREAPWERGRLVRKPRRDPHAGSRSGRPESGDRSPQSERICGAGTFPGGRVAVFAMLPRARGETRAQCPNDPCAAPNLPDFADETPGTRRSHGNNRTKISGNLNDCLHQNCLRDINKSSAKTQ